MIGNTGDFEVEDYVDDRPEPKDEISDFGTDFGVEDGWSDEMQGIGYFGAAPMSKTRLNIPKAKKRLFSHSFGSHPMAGFDGGQMGSYLSDLQAKLKTGLAQTKTSIQTAADKALAAEKAKIQAQLDAKKAQMVAQAKQTITTQATNLINKAADTATSKINSAIVSGANSPVVQGAIQAGTSSAIDKAIAFKDEMMKKSKPVVIAASAGIALFIIYKIYSARKARV